MESYDPQSIEKKWQAAWEDDGLYRTADTARGKKNFMLLVEFPYPSGNLHIGHWYAFALPDIRARHLRMCGQNVMYPIGFDAFGLPAENAAIKHDTNPEAWTRGNIAHMTEQIQSMGTMFDWSRTVSTIDPEYYRWTQWMFLQMQKKGLAYRASTTVNWCPKDQTVLANEQVIQGRCERCNTEVEQRKLEQWMMRITDYADRLIDDSEVLDWPRTTKLAQQNWIGRSHGARITWKLNVPGQASEAHAVDTFTTRPDTLFGATFLVIAPEKAQEWIDIGWDAPEAVRVYIKEALGKRELERLEGGTEKTGVATGITAVHPFLDEEIPVWIADYVLGSYGTGAIMAVPAHDGRDYEFAKKFDLHIKTVVQSSEASDNVPYEGHGVLVDSGPYSGSTSEEAMQAIAAALQEKGIGGPETTYKLRDWVISRQRYWGVPIPMVFCEKCGWQPVSEKDLPVHLPKLENYLPTADGKGPLAKDAEFVQTTCPNCDGIARRETDTMDTFVDSSWYFLRYTDPSNQKEFASSAKLKKWMPVPLYIGGAEHNTMHLLYARFFTKVLHDLGHLQFDEPFVARRNRGIILGPDGQKMSKSRGNVVDPDVEVAKYGADTVRMYLAFMAPYAQGGPWDPKGITGVHRFLQRVWKLFHAQSSGTARDETVERALHATTKKLGEDLESLSLNTCVSELMKLLNTIEKSEQSLNKDQQEHFLLLLAPFAPHIAEELWTGVLKKKKSIHLQEWPKYDAGLLQTDTIDIPVQVNGKVRAVVTIQHDASQQDVEFTARQDENVAKYLEGATLRTTVYVPGKLLNFVVEK